MAGRSAWLAAAVAALAVGGVLPSSQAVSTAPARAPKAHVVLAVVEDLFNPYHHEFAAAERQASPATWLPGYPRSAAPLRLHLGEHDYARARHLDDRTWASLRPGQLYYLPGTRISGLVYLPSPLDTLTASHAEFPPPSDPPRPVVDGGFHGAGATSVAAGTRYGTCPDCDIVVVASNNPEDGLAWAAKQPWIDVISNSWGGVWGQPTQATPGHAERAADAGASPGSLAAARAGKVVLFGSGNGITDLGPTTHGTQHAITWDEPYAGPPWVLAVGAAKAQTGQPTDWHNIPVDVIAQGEDRPAAAADSLTGEMTFYGTSCSSPVAAGVIAEALLLARRAAGDGHVGTGHGRLLTRGTTALTYRDVISAAKAVATWKPFDPATVSDDPYQAFATPTSQAAFAYEGYGRLDRDSIGPLAKVLSGAMPLPSRPEMSDWESLAQQVRAGRWGAVPDPRR
jgi:Subtilase family